MKEKKYNAPMSTPKPFLPSSKQPILSQARDTATLCWSFLDTKDVINLSQSCKEFQSEFRNTITKKKKASELLQHVFNADPRSVKEFLIDSKIETKDVPFNPFSLLWNQKKHKENKGYKEFQLYLAKHLFPIYLLSKSKGTKNSHENICIVLTRSNCKEEDYSPSLKKKMVKRTWKNISPLEAAAWCGDNFLVKDLLKFVPKSQLKEAAQQLRGILERKETAENGGYLAPFQALLKAYDKFSKQKDELNGDHHHDDFIWANMVKLWNQVWECQRKLPTYGLQEYFDEKPYKIAPPFPKPSFKIEPSRYGLYFVSIRYTSSYWDSIHEDHTPLDLNSMKNGHALYKNGKSGVSVTDANGVAFWTDEQILLDFYAIGELCSIRKAELENIIKELLASLSDDLDENESMIAVNGKVSNLF